jgi:glycosyltransferase involved in cell wall biosynthesis
VAKHRRAAASIATVVAEGDAPLVTVIAMTMNHERWAPEALAGIASQTVRDVQLIITDDASADNTPSVVRSWIATSALGTTFIAHTRRAGICATLNEALSFARGKFIAIVSLDDIWLPAHLEEGLNAFAAASPGTAVVYSDVQLIDDDGEPLGYTFLRGHVGMGTPDRPVPMGEVFRELIDVNFVPAASAIIKASALAAVGPYDESLLYEDYDMWLRLARQNTFHYIDSITAYYRVHETSFFHKLHSERRYFDTEFALLAKARGHDKDADVLIERRLRRIARSSFFSGQPNGRAHLRAVARMNLTPRNASLGLVSLIPVPPIVFRKARDIGRRARGRLRGGSVRPMYARPPAGTTSR